MRSDEVIKALIAAGWRKVGQKGSHVQFKHPNAPGRVTVPHPNAICRLALCGRLRNNPAFV